MAHFGDRDPATADHPWQGPNLQEKSNKHMACTCRLVIGNKKKRTGHVMVRRSVRPSSVGMR
jgi:hypothetical protein